MHLHFSAFQTTEQERKAAGSLLHSDRLHGAQCSRADGQLRGECLHFATCEDGDSERCV